MSWKTPFLQVKKGQYFGIQAISAPIFSGFFMAKL